MRRLLILAAATLLLGATVLPAPDVARAADRVPKVAIIVGPAGGATAALPRAGRTRRRLRRPRS